MKLLGVEEARARMLARAVRLEPETVRLDEALGRVVAKDVIAARHQPPFAASAMDGWAVRAVDTPGTLSIVGESAAGRGYAGRIGPGQAARIFTGAPIPAGADAVVMQEDASHDGDALTTPAAGSQSHIRMAGLDFRAGDTLLRAGTRLDAWRLALAAATGRAELTVFRQPRVVVMATGEEIVAPGAAVRHDQIFDSASTSLTALVQSWGGQGRASAGVGDDEAAIARTASGAGGDILVTVGGASVGDHDLVKAALIRLGLALEVESIAIRPGKPTWFGVIADGRLVLGLPGNPASAMVCAELFLRPLLAVLQGADPALPLIAARTTVTLPVAGAREQWMRAELAFGPSGEVLVTPFSNQDSSLVGVFARADALVRRAAGAPAIAAGGIVETLRLSRL